MTSIFLMGLPRNEQWRKLLQFHCLSEDDSHRGESAEDVNPAYEGEHPEWVSEFTVSREAGLVTILVTLLTTSEKLTLEILDARAIMTTEELTFAATPSGSLRRSMGKRVDKARGDLDNKLAQQSAL